MSTGRLTIRSLAVLLTTFLVGVPGDASAGCLDCLFGRPTTYTAGYPYAPYGYPSAGTYPAGTVQSAMPPVTVTPMNSAVVQAQMPAYGTPVYNAPALTTVQSFDNPSVYSGLPVNNTPPVATQSYSPQYSAQRLPVASQAPITSFAPTVTSYAPVAPDAYGQSFTTANRVPIATTLRGNTSINPITAGPVNSTYSSYYGSTAYNGTVAPVTYNAPPTGPTLTGSTQALPLATPPRRTFGSGLSRFFNSLLGRNTNYVTSYYQAPITYYRPMTTVDPSSGTTVTVQQPCSSYVQQLQRVPYNSFAPTGSNTLPLQTGPDVCSTPMVGTPGSFVPPSSSIGQVGGEIPLDGYGVSPIPSTMPDASYPNTAPLSNTAPFGGGSNSDPTATAPNAADREVMPPPELKSNRPATESPAEPLSGEALSEEPLSGEENRSNSYFKKSYGDDIYPYGSSNPGANDDDNGQSETPTGPAIRLDPPVTNRFQDPQHQFTNSTPPSVKSVEIAPSDSGRQYSTMPPIGASAAQQEQPNATNSQGVTLPPSTRTLEPPQLPAPSQRGPDPSALFRNTETSASSRYPVPSRVSVPVREATTRQQNVRQVAAWEEFQQRRTPKPAAPVKRDNSGWRPAR